MTYIRKHPESSTVPAQHLILLIYGLLIVLARLEWLPFLFLHIQYSRIDKDFRILFFRTVAWKVVSEVINPPKILYPPVLTSETVCLKYYVVTMIWCWYIRSRCSLWFFLISGWSWRIFFLLLLVDLFGIPQTLKPRMPNDQTNEIMRNMPGNFVCKCRHWCA